MAFAAILALILDGVIIAGIYARTEYKLIQWGVGTFKQQISHQRWYLCCTLLCNHLCKRNDTSVDEISGV